MSEIEKKKITRAELLELARQGAASAMAGGVRSLDHLQPHQLEGYLERYEIVENDQQSMFSKLDRTGRGFPILRFTDFYHKACTLQSSSLATEECVWLGVNEAEPKIMCSDAARLGIPTTRQTGWMEYVLPEQVSMTTRMHLTREQAGELAKQLQVFADTGELT